MRGVFALVLAAIVVIPPASVSATKTFFIDEPMQYTGSVPGRVRCVDGATDLPNYTSSFVTDLGANGWFGVRYSGTNAWGIDWYEHAIRYQGIDHLEADNALLSVFVGHGSGGAYDLGLQFGFRSPSGFDDCKARYSDMSLGLNWGAQSAFLVAASCCTLTEYWIYPQSQLRQMFGYRGTAGMTSSILYSFFHHTDTLYNTQSWIEYAQGTSNMPSVFTAAATAGDAWAYHNWCMFRYQDRCLYVPDKPLNGYAFSYIDGPCSGCQIAGCM